MRITYREACETLKEPEEWLEFYHAHEKDIGSFYVNYQHVGKNGDFFSKWAVYGTKEYTKYFEEELKLLPNNREIFPCEIVIDIDTETPYENKKLAQQFSTIFRNCEMSHTVWRSGSGNGHHLHLWFDELKKFLPRDRTLLKKHILNYFCGKHYSEKRIVDLSASNPKKLIALECAPHRKSGRRKTLVFSYFKNNHGNKIPQLALDKFYKEKKDIELSVQKSREAGFTQPNTDKKPAVIAFLETQDFAEIKDGRRTALFILANYYKTRLDNDALFSYLCNWRDTLHPDYRTELSDWFIKYTIDNAIYTKMSERTMKEKLQGIYNEVNST